MLLKILENLDSSPQCSWKWKSNPKPFYIHWHNNLVLTRFLAGEGNGNPFQYSCLENPMDGGAWWPAVHGVAKSQTGLSDFTFTFHFHALEKEMATHSSVLTWRIPGTGEPGGLASLGSHRVGHDWSDLAVAAYTDLRFKNEQNNSCVHAQSCPTLRLHLL